MLKKQKVKTTGFFILCVSFLVIVIWGNTISTAEQDNHEQNYLPILEKAKDDDPVLNISLSNEFKINVDGFIHTPMWDKNNNILYFNLVDESVPYQIGDITYFKQQLYKVDIYENEIKAVEKIHDDFHLLDISVNGDLLGKSVNKGEGNNLYILKGDTAAILGEGIIGKFASENIITSNENGVTVYDNTSLKPSLSSFTFSSEVEDDYDFPLEMIIKNNIIASINSEYLLVINDGKNETKVINNLGNGLGSTLPDIVWKNQSEKLIAFTVSPDPKIIEIDKDGQYKVLKTKMLVHLSTPSLTPDDNFLFYSARPTGAGVEALSELYVLNLKTGGEAQLSFDHIEQRSPSLSPDGRFLAYISNDSLVISIVNY